MKITKRFLATIFITIFQLSISCGVAAQGKFQSEKLNTIQFSGSEFLETPMEQSICIDGVAGKYNGKTYLYTASSGTPPHFNVINMEDRVIEGIFPLSDSPTGSPRTHKLDSKGNVFFASNTNVYKYDPVTKQITPYGNPFSQKSIYDLKCDEEDNFYFGTYPSGYLVKLDTKSGAFINLGVPQPDSQYVRSLAYQDGVIYTGGQAASNKITVQDFDTGQKEIIEIPPEIGTVTSVYSMTIGGNYLFVNLEGKFTEDSSTGFAMAIYDIRTKKAIHVIQGSNHITPSEAYDGMVYFNAKGYLYQFNVEQGTLEKTEIKANFATRGYSKATVAGKEVLITITYGGYPLTLDLETGEIINYMDLMTKGSGVELTNILYNPYTKSIYVGGHAGSYGVEYNVRTRQITNKFNWGQPEGMAFDDSILYGGVYPAGTVMKFDASQPVGNGNSKTLFEIGEDQQRPFAMLIEDGKLYIGTIPFYSNLGGALTVMDLTTAEYKVKRNIVRDQSVISLTTHNGLIYGSTSISGGLGINPTAKEAKIFIYDPKTDTVIKEFTPQFPSKMPTPVRAIGSIQFGPDGMLWGFCKEMLFSLNPETLEVEKTLFFNDKIVWYDGHIWKGPPVNYGSNGLIYTVLNEMIHVIDPETLEFIRIKEIDKKVNNFTLDERDHIYFTSGANVYKIQTYHHPLTQEEISDVYKELEQGVALRAGENIAVINGKVAHIDEMNPQVVPLLSQDRLLIPARFVSEAFGATATYEDPRVFIETEKKKIVFQIGTSTYQVNKEEKQMDTAAIVMENRLMIPLRALGEGLDKQVFWDESGIVIISDEKTPYEQDREALSKLRDYFDQYLEAEFNKTKKEEELVLDDAFDLDYAANRLSLRNGGFEVGQGGNVPGFRLTSPLKPGISYQLSKIQSGEGKQSLYLSTSGNPLILEGEAVKVAPGTSSITLRGKLFLESGIFELSLLFCDQDLKPLSRQQVKVQTNSGIWQPVILSGQAPGKWEYVVPVLSFSGKGSAYVDDLRLFGF